MKNLMEQILKFGVVGFVCFLIDFGITTGFMISAVVNYILSIKFVFTKKKEMDKKKEFTVFIILSAFGLLINEVVMYVCMDGIYVNNGFLQEAVTREMMVSLSSIVATGIVMVYNFISRKLFLERK